MCDTIVVTADCTADGVTIFAKNTDREPNEAHHVIAVAAADHPRESTVKCTYIDIPQATHTYAVLLAKPFWIWGAEMGVNEHGVAIGNEAVFAKVPYGKENRLIGMDLLRLGLERAATAHEAVTVITQLLDAYGQGGNCGFLHKLYYHNSFLIADPRDAWVLETAGPHWAARQVKGVYTISNGLTIGSEWDLASPDLVSHAVRKGWCKGREDFHFARCYSDFIYTTFSDSRKRRQRAMDLLSSRQDDVTAADAAAALRDHGEAQNLPDKGLAGANVCAHAGLGPIRGSQTTGSMVSHLHPEHPTHFVTATAAPCTSLLKPVWLDAPLPDMGPAPTGTYDAATLYWRHESLHRSTLGDYAISIQLYNTERDNLERRFITEALAMATAPAPERAEFAARCFAEADTAEARWLEQVRATTKHERRSWHHAMAWKSFNRKAKMPF